jgi:steroid Delta-isomerase
MTNHTTALAKLQQFFTSLDAQSVSQLHELYCVDAYFKDPFNEVHDLAAIEQIFRHMFVQVQSPRFVIRETLLQGNGAFLVWDFCFRMRRWNHDEQVVRGASHIQFDESGKVAYHRDYWDAAEELYEKLPLLGGFMRMLKSAARN